MIIERATAVTDELLAALQALVPQLGRGKVPPTWDQLEALVRSEASTMLTARYPGEADAIVGILTLAIYRVPTGVRSIVEDVIVDENFRRRGIAEALLTHAVDMARKAGAGNVSLSANRAREAAHKLYQKLGFTRRESIFYILQLK